MALKIVRRAGHEALVNGANLVDAIVQEGIRSLGSAENSKFDVEFPAAERAIEKIHSGTTERNRLRPPRIIPRPSLVHEEMIASSLADQIRREGEHFSR